MLQGHLCSHEDKAPTVLCFSYEIVISLLLLIDKVQVELARQLVHQSVAESTKLQSADSMENLADDEGDELEGGGLEPAVAGRRLGVVWFVEILAALASCVFTSSSCVFARLCFWCLAGL